MQNIYAMSDIHDNQEEFEKNFDEIIKADLDSNRESKLILLGDYLSRFDISTDILYYLKNLQQKYPNQIIICMGNHELNYINDLEQRGINSEEVEMINWLKTLPYYYETEKQIYVHAGIDEEAPDSWYYSPKSSFCNKYPPVLGEFAKDIIAGHVATSQIANDINYNKVFWDYENHFYIDGNTEETNFIPVLKYNTATNRYTSFELDNTNNKWVEYTIK